MNHDGKRGKYVGLGTKYSSTRRLPRPRGEANKSPEKVPWLSGAKLGLAGREFWGNCALRGRGAVLGTIYNFSCHLVVLRTAGALRYRRHTKQDERRGRAHPKQADKRTRPLRCSHRARQRFFVSGTHDDTPARQHTIRPNCHHDMIGTPRSVDGAFDKNKKHNSSLYGLPL